MIRQAAMLLLFLPLATAVSAQTPSIRTPPTEGPHHTYAQFKQWSGPTQQMFIQQVVDGITAAFQRTGERWPEEIHAGLTGCTVKAPFVHEVLLDAVTGEKYDNHSARYLVFEVYVMACGVEKEMSKRRDGAKR